MKQTVILLATFLLLFACFSTKAQYKRSSVGLRAGGLSGVAFKYIDNDLTAFELILGAREGGMTLAGLIQKYTPIATAHFDGLYMFTGAGAHAGYTRSTEYYTQIIEGIPYYGNYKETNPVIGGDFVFGLAYHFESIPMHLSLDYKPYFELFGQKDFRVDLWDIGFSVRYSINQ
jgi:hypothetical protein